MNRDTQKRLFNLCDPREPLGPDDPRYVDVDAFAGAPRGRRWVEVLASPIEMASRPVCTLLAAQPGAGLTTELRSLAGRLRDPSGANLLPVHIDAVEVLDLHSTIDVSDVLLAIVEKVEVAVHAAEGQPGKRLARFWRWLRDTSPEITEEETEFAATTILRASPRARSAFRLNVSAEHSRFVSEVRNELTLLNGRARRLGRGGLVVLFDGITRLRGDSTTWKEVLASAERLFGMDASYLELPVHVVYTVPAPLALRLSTPILFFPQIALLDRAGKRAAGLDAAREIVRRRVGDEELAQVFAAYGGHKPRTNAGRPITDDHSPKGNPEAWVDELLLWSAGNPRDIVQLLRNSIIEAMLHPPRFKQMLSLSADGLRRTTPETANPWLARVHIEKTLAFPDDQRLLADRLVLDGAVLRYQNGEGWYDVHPVLLETSRVSAEIARLSRSA